MKYTSFELVFFLLFVFLGLLIAMFRGLSESLGHFMPSSASVSAIFSKLVTQSNRPKICREMKGLSHFV